MEQPKQKPVEAQLLAARKDSGESTDRRNTRPERHRLPDERRALTHHFSIGGHEGYLTVGLYEDGGVGELFIKMAKEGSTVSGLMDGFATAVSLALQHGVALSVLCEKFSHTRFEPSGWSGNAEIGYATSLCDYIFRYLRLRFVDGEQTKLSAVPAPQPVFQVVQSDNPGHALGQVVELGDAPVCVHCGSLMVPNGSRCFRCMSCGHTNGCG